METFFDQFVIVILFAQIVKYSASFEEKPDCPLDCICYPEYLSNLASWRWIEKDVHSTPNDPEHNEFNPYTDHNEVYDNPNVAINLREDPLRTVTCILRGDSSVGLTKTFNQLPSATQVLSLLQAAGSGNITLGKEHFEKLPFLIGVEIQGYTKIDGDAGQGINSFRLEADAFVHLHKLVYLNLENVVIHQRSLQHQGNEYTSKLVKVTRISSVNNNSFDDNIMNELESQLMFVSPNGKREEEIILPYNEYKKEAAKLARNQPVPTDPKVAVAFTNMLNLIHLRISRCNMQDMSWDMFYKLVNLKYLLLEKNDLLFLPDFVFYSTPNLTVLSLSGNRILSLQTVGLAGLLSLQKLDMTNNNITHLSELSLPPFPNLEVADFRFNPIETIFPNTFEVMNTTKTLYLGSTKVPLIFFPNSFFGLVALTKLDIANVRIGFLEKPMLKGVPQLKHLLMDGHIQRISYDAFGEVPKLETLILKKCGIEKISMDAFYGLNALIELDLSHNKLTYLSPGIFEDQVSLREVYLQRNQLTTLGRDLFSRTPAKLIRLEGNPWHCSCEMGAWNPYIVNQVKRYHIPSNTSPTCQIKYDKGSMCHRETTGFKVKYVYEKRVSPVCETPKKFNKRSIFEVIRKELRYCEISTATSVLPEVLNIKVKPGKVNPAKPLSSLLTKTKKKNIKSVIVKTPEQLVKEHEKRLLSIPSKPRKPTQNIITITPIATPKEVEEVKLQTTISAPKQIEEELKAIPGTAIPFKIEQLKAIPTTTILNQVEEELKIVGSAEKNIEPLLSISSAKTDLPNVFEKIMAKTPEPTTPSSIISIVSISSAPTVPPPTTTPFLFPKLTPNNENEMSNQLLFQTNSMPVQFPIPTNEPKNESVEFKQRIRKPKNLLSNHPNPRHLPISKKAMKLAKLEKIDSLLKRKP